MMYWKSYAYTGVLWSSPYWFKRSFRVTNQYGGVVVEQTVLNALKTEISLSN